MHAGSAKTFLKIEGITSKKSDIILISDCRAGNKGNRLEELMNITNNGSYKLYLNSTKEARGVGIAISSRVQHEVIETHMDRITENFIILKVSIRGVTIGLGAVYGPNRNDEEFYKRVRTTVESLNVPYILGGGLQHNFRQRSDIK
jgi:hypothetical protein